MTPKHHNPGNPLRLTLGQEEVVAFSISALATYALLPQLSVAFDMGECPLEAVPLNHVFLSHAHGDHSRCLLRHESLRRLMGMAPATYYVPAETLEGFVGLAEAWKKLERVGERNAALPNFKAMAPGDVIWLHRQLAAKAFRAHHGLPSLGYTLFDVRQKLKPEYQGLPGHELGALRRQGVTFEEELWLPRFTFLGDHTIRTLEEEAATIGQSKVLMMELTFLLEDEVELAHQRGHMHLEDLLGFVKEAPDVLQNEHIVLKHFSMRYPRAQIVDVLQKRLPPDLMERVTLLV